MRKITRLAARAFIEGRSFRKDNTSVTYKADVLDPLCVNMQLRLHDNLIAEWIDVALPHSMNLRITLAGWPTVTTRERLNGLLTELGKREGVWQHKHEQYYGTHEDSRVIDSSEWITVS